MTIWNDNAALVATTDREERADWLLDVACKQALADLRAGRRYGDPQAPVSAVLKLAQAQRKASRILGRRAA